MPYKPENSLIYSMLVTLVCSWSEIDLNLTNSIINCDEIRKEGPATLEFNSQSSQKLRNFHETISFVSAKTCPRTSHNCQLDGNRTCPLCHSSLLLCPKMKNCLLTFTQDYDQKWHVCIAQNTNCLLREFSGYFLFKFEPVPDSVSWTTSYHLVSLLVS